MTPAKSQYLHNHRRWNPLYHFIALPIFLLNFGVATWQAVGDHGVWNLWQFVVSLGFVAGLLAARGMALVVQDRIIRLEMRLRLREVLPAALAPRAGQLTKRQLVALRFAGDAELPALVERCLKGELVSRRAIKREVRDWQADWLRV